MQQTVESTKTLLVDGPASVQLVSGKAEVFAKQLNSEAKVLVPEGKRLPFFALEKAVLEISLGANASFQEVTGNTVSQSWEEPVKAVLDSQQKPVTVLVLGKVDSGKSSFCTYLVNKLVNAKGKVAVIDGDLGQSDIGPSGTVGYAIMQKPVTQLRNLKLQNAFFVGVTSPLLAIAKTIEGLAQLKGEVLQHQVDFIVINTDGWVSGDLALRYKTALIKELKPDIVVGVTVQNELDDLIDNLNVLVLKVYASPFLGVRTAEKRKLLRETTYARYLEAAKVQCYPLSQVMVEPRGSLPQKQDPEKGLLVGLYSGTKLLGIGVLREINNVRKVLKIQTPVVRKTTKIVLGKVWLDKKGREIAD